MGENNHALVFCLWNLLRQVQNTSSFLWLFYQIFISNTWQPPTPTPTHPKKKTKNSVVVLRTVILMASMLPLMISWSECQPSQTEKTLDWHQLHIDPFVWDRCLIDVDPRVFAIWVSSSDHIDCFEQDCTQIAKTFGPTSIWHRSDTSVSDRCLINVNPMVCAI